MKTTTNSPSKFTGQRIGLTLDASNIAALDRARADIRDRAKKAVDRNQLVDRILARVDFAELVDEYVSEPRIVV